MTEIIIIRHGETEWNKTGRFQGHSDIALSQEGRAQAAALGRNLAGDDVDAIYASDLTRAMETAAPLAKRFGLEVIPDAALRELNFGAWEGRNFHDVNAEYPGAMKNFYNDPELADIPDSENFTDFQKTFFSIFFIKQVFFFIYYLFCLIYYPYKSSSFCNIFYSFRRIKLNYRILRYLRIITPFKSTITVPTIQLLKLFLIIL